MFETTVPSPLGEHSGGDPTPDSTRTRLLDAAGQVFAEHGFAKATVREICRVAGTNLAAVNYHFGGKDRLYSEVLRYADELSMARHPEFPIDPAVHAKHDPEVLLGLFVRQFLSRVFDTERPVWHDLLIAREMVEPTPALEELAAKNIRPRAQLLQGIIRRLIGPEATPAQVQLCAASVVGQCLIYHRCRVMVTHLMPDIRVDHPDAVAVLSDHVTRFSLGAIAAMSRCPARDAGGVDPARKETSQ